jgi:hypothetical protein
MAAKLIRLTHKIAIQLHLLAESCTICSSRSRQPVRNLLDKPSKCSHETLPRVPFWAEEWSKNEYAEEPEFYADICGRRKVETNAEKTVGLFASYSVAVV